MTSVPGESAIGFDSAKVERFDDDGNPIEDEIEDEGDGSDAEHD